MIKIRANQLQPGDLVILHGREYTVDDIDQDGPLVYAYVVADTRPWLIPAQHRVQIHNR